MPEASIIITAQDRYSSAVKEMGQTTKAFSKDAEELEETLRRLNTNKFSLKLDLKEAQKQLREMEKQFAATGAEADGLKLQLAQANYDNIKRNFDLVTKGAAAAERQLRKTGEEARRQGAGNGFATFAKGMATAGIGRLWSDAVTQAGDAFLSSAIGEPEARMATSILSGAVAGGTMGAALGPTGIAVGAALGGLSGLVSGGAEIFRSQDEAFKDYYRQMYENGQTAGREGRSDGSALAAQRELDVIAFERLLGEGVGKGYLEDLRALAAATPMEYSDLTTMSRALAPGFGDSPERMLALMEAIGDAGSAVGLTAADMTEMARAMSRMNSSGKATLEYLNILQDRGVNVIGMLSEELGKSQGEIYDMISRGRISGQNAVDIIQRGMGNYSGAMETMARSFPGLTSTLEDTMAELDNARGEGYNTIRKDGMQEEINAYGGPLGAAVENVNRIAGKSEAYLENLSERYTREALEAVLLGESASGIYGPEQQKALEEMRTQFVAASAAYEAGSQEAGIKMDSLRREAEALATAAYESSEQYQMWHDAELDLIGAIRENTAALGGWKNDYETQQELSRGRGAAVLNGGGGRRPEGRSAYHDLGYGREAGRAAYHAYGLDRVPYDGYAAILHEGERVLTASQARQMDRGGGESIQINLTGEWHVERKEDAERVAETILRRIQLAKRGGVRT